MKNKIITALLMFFSVTCAYAQPKPGQVIDEIAAIVGDNIVMQSEIEIEFQQLQKDIGLLNDSAVCEIMRQKLIEKMLLMQAQLDSIELPDERLDAELNRRIRLFAMQFPGGEKEMEQVYGKTSAEIKANNRDKIKAGMLVQEMQNKILKDVKVSPTDIKKYYKELVDVDSVPFYSAEVEVAQLVIAPKVSKEAKELAYEKISELRQRIVNGDNFSTLALIYSDDKGSAVKNGELGFFSRGDMVPEFEAAAFKLKPDSISKIIETKYGYHILQLIDRKGENINVRHILIRPQIFRGDVSLAKERIDSIMWQVKIDSLKFEDAVKKFSDDEESFKSRGGFITDGAVGSTRIPLDELDKSIYYTIEKMKPGDYTQPELITLPTPDRQQVWRVFYLKSETAPHRANLKDDYQKLQAVAASRKQMRTMQNWIEKHKGVYYIQVSEGYKTCPSIQDLLIRK